MVFNVFEVLHICSYDRVYFSTQYKFKLKYVDIFVTLFDRWHYRRLPLDGALWSHTVLLSDIQYVVLVFCTCITVLR